MLQEYIKNTNHRLTKQRQVILEELCNVGCHPTAQEIHKMVIKRMPNVSFATVYRNLDFLASNDFIIKLQTKDKKTRYDGNTNPHIHLICKECGEVTDIFDCECKMPCSKQIKDSGFQINTERIEIPGFCKDCKS